jgi:hypothetical protein
MVGEKLKEVGQVFGKHYGTCLLSPLNMVSICISSYNWIIYLYLSHTNPMIHYTPSTHLKSSMVTVALCFNLSLSQVNVSKSFVMPHNVQGNFHLKPTIL